MGRGDRAHLRAACAGAASSRSVLYVTLLTLAYAPVRFGLDFLRATDVPEPDARYFGLTPAQWGCVLVLFAGIGLAVWTRRHARASV